MVCGVCVDGVCVLVHSYHFFPRHSDLPTVVALPAEAFGIDSKDTYRQVWIHGVHYLDMMSPLLA